MDLIGPAQAHVDFVAAVVGVAPDHFGLAVADPGGPVIRRGGRLERVPVGAPAQQCQRRDGDKTFHPCPSTDGKRRQP
ncbi:hypothetical protein D3C76_1498610 [compost metagenome]